MGTYDYLKTDAYKWAQLNPDLFAAFSATGDMHSRKAPWVQAMHKDSLQGDSDFFASIFGAPTTTGAHARTSDILLRSLDEKSKSLSGAEGTFKQGIAAGDAGFERAEGTLGSVGAGFQGQIESRGRERMGAADAALQDSGLYSSTVAQSARNQVASQTDRELAGLGDSLATARSGLQADRARWLGSGMQGLAGFQAQSAESRSDDINSWVAHIMGKTHIADEDELGLGSVLGGLGGGLIGMNNGGLGMAGLLGGFGSALGGFLD